METEYHRQALRLLVENTRLSVRAEKLLGMLVITNPVALRGEPTMIMNSTVIDLLGLSGSPYMKPQDALNEVKWVLREIADAAWQVPSTMAISPEAFLENYWISENPTFLHFQLKRTFIGVLMRISQHL